MLPYVLTPKARRIATSHAALYLASILDFGLFHLGVINCLPNWPPSTLIARPVTEACSMSLNRSLPSWEPSSPFFSTLLSLQ